VRIKKIAFMFAKAIVVNLDELNVTVETEKFIIHWNITVGVEQQLFCYNGSRYIFVSPFPAKGIIIRALPLAHFLLDFFKIFPGFVKNNLVHSAAMVSLYYKLSGQISPGSSAQVVKRVYQWH